MTISPGSRDWTPDDSAHSAPPMGARDERMAAEVAGWSDVQLEHALPRLRGIIDGCEVGTDDYENAHALARAVAAERDNRRQLREAVDGCAVHTEVGWVDDGFDADRGMHWVPAEDPYDRSGGDGLGPLV